MKVAVVLCMYNNAAHIWDAIKSVKEQIFPHWYVILVDNGSTDNSVKLANEIIKDDPRFSIFRKANEGPSAGRNFGISKLSPNTRYVHFLDGDDMIKPQFLQTLVQYLEENQQVGVVSCHYDKLDEAGNFIGKGYRSRYAPGIFSLPKKLKDQNHNTPFQAYYSATGQGPYALFRKEILDKTGGYEETFWSHEDSDIFCSMALKAEIHHLPEFLYMYRIRKTSLSRSGQKTYNLFRDKWDFYISSNTLENNLIEASLKYYYTRHKPLRDLKVCGKAFKEFLRTQNLHSLKWSCRCLFEGGKDLIFHRTYKDKLKRRKQLLSHQERDLQLK